MAKITIYGLERYLNQENDSLFADLQLPEGLDKNILIDSIMLDVGEMASLYGDPNFIKPAIAAWGRKYYVTFEKWQSAWMEEYNPTHNYDRFEEVQDEGTSKTDTTSNATTTGKVSAFDQLDYASNDQMTNTGTGGAQSENKLKHNAHIFGNIGVTSTMDLIQQEMGLREKFNPYQLITDLFAQNFCVLVYD